MTKRITRLALVVGAAAAFAAPAAPAHAVPSCSATIGDCIDQILRSIAIAPAECIEISVTVAPICPPAAG